MEEPSTLADALLDDLDELSDQENGNELGKQLSNDDDSFSFSRNLTIDDSFLHDPQLLNHLNSIRESENVVLAATEIELKQELDDDEYTLIVQSNKQLARLADELSRAHGHLCELYQAKFPELEEILPNPVQYKNAVKIIRNEMDISLINDGLNEFLTPNQVLTVSVSASTTSGRPLKEDVLINVDQAIKYMEDLINLQDELSAFVGRRMERIAPNVSAILGPRLTAQLLGLAGGLEELSKIPACNLQVIGQTRQTSSSRGGMSSTHTRPNEGILRECVLVQQCARNFQLKALKTVVAKVALAARCDFVNLSSGRDRDDSAGRAFYQEIEGRIKKFGEGDKAPTLKTLPKPDLTIKKRRGGKRIRRLKEKFEETAMMKQANTRAFGTQAGEYGDDVMGLTRGLLDTQDVSAGGALRKKTEKRKMTYANTKASRKKIAQMNASNPTSGLATSVAFTPVQGMELVDPDANKHRVAQANKNWFSESAGFISALPKL
ncbi:hypothetical protein MPSEU_000375600 [Mayamaea pseudoterrestris]|nr:hypothetical protein MPSEU_000375600 [Mayamaea pseudoterrestris]